MRLKQSRLKTYYHRKRTVQKDNEGSTYEEYGAASSFPGNPGLLPGKSRRSSMDSDLVTSVM